MVGHNHAYGCIVHREQVLRRKNDQLTDANHKIKEMGQRNSSATTQRHLKQKRKESRGRLIPGNAPLTPQLATSWLLGQVTQVAQKRALQQKLKVDMARRRELAKTLVDRCVGNHSKQRPNNTGAFSAHTKKMLSGKENTGPRLVVFAMVGGPARERRGEGERARGGTIQVGGDPARPIRARGHGLEAASAAACGGRNGRKRT